ncbi:MAG: hypothetical protein EXQ56_09285 [Acidobacteria bacterium]|nr:hypothetical protein [Acidobacteriota bacterium]
MTQPPIQSCSHARVEVISQDANGKFFECLDCREIFESAELDELLAKVRKEGEKEADHQEGLSDA